MNYPATIGVSTPDRIDRWRPLVQWILAIPHLVLASVLQNVGEVVAVISWFVILFTGKLPAGLANFQVMALRYSARAEIYAGFLHAAYPPFEFAMTGDDPGGTPVTYTIRPALEDRNRLTVGLRFIWAIPALLWVLLIGIIGAICWILGFFAVLFTGRWPQGLHRWVLASLRVSIRASAYIYLLTDDYPPFVTD